MYKISIIYLLKVSLQGVGGEACRLEEVMVNVASEFVTDHSQLVVPLHPTWGAALDVWVLVLQQLCGGQTWGQASLVELGAGAGGNIKRSSNWTLTIQRPSLSSVQTWVTGGRDGVTAVCGWRERWSYDSLWMEGEMELRQSVDGGLLSLFILIICPCLNMYRMPHKAN